MRILLSLGVAILYPVVIYFMVVTIVPRSSNSQFPDYPNCYNDFQSSRFKQDNCDREYNEYQRKIDAYHDSAKREDEKNVTRAQIALGIALLTVLGMMLLRDVKELVGGLTVGATVVIISAVTIMLANAGSEDPKTGNVLLILLSFAFLTSILYLTERALPVRTVPPVLPKEPEQ